MGLPARRGAWPGARSPRGRRWTAGHAARLWLYASAALAAEHLLAATPLRPSSRASVPGAGPAPAPAPAGLPAEEGSDLAARAAALVGELLEAWGQVFHRSIKRNPNTDDMDSSVACRAAENLILCIFVVICALEWRESKHREAAAGAGSFKDLACRDSLLSQVTQGNQDLQRQYSLLSHGFIQERDSEAQSEASAPAEISEVAAEAPAADPEAGSTSSGLATAGTPEPVAGSSESGLNFSLRSTPSRSLARAATRAAMRTVDQAAVSKIVDTLHEGIKAVLEVDVPRKWDSCAVPAFAQLRRAVLHASRCPEALAKEAAHAPAVLHFLSSFVDRYPIRVKQACEVVSILAKHPGWAAMLPGSEVFMRGRAHAELHCAAKRASRLACPPSLQPGAAAASAGPPAPGPAERQGEAGTPLDRSTLLERSCSGMSLGGDGRCLSRKGSAGKISGASTPRPGGQAGEGGDTDSFFIGDRGHDVFDRGVSWTPTEADLQEFGRPSGELAVNAVAVDKSQEGAKWQIMPSIAMMVLLHVIYPSYPMSPQVVLGRISTFLGVLWCLGSAQCAELVRLDPIRIHWMLFLAVLCAIVQVCLWSVSHTIGALIFPLSDQVELSCEVPRHLSQLLQYLSAHLPPQGADVGRWASWSVVCVSAAAGAIWEEFLFRGIYLSSLRTRVRFWPANAAVSLAYALEHEPVGISADGLVGIRAGPLLPLLVGAFWCGYVYDKSGSLAVTILAHILVDAGLIWFYITAHDTRLG